MTHFPYEAAGRTGLSPSRTTPQQALLIRRDLGLFVVGEATGVPEAASSAVAALETFCETVASLWLSDLLDARSQALGLLVLAVEMASTPLDEAAVRDPGQRGLGASLAAALVKDETVCVAHVGDCQIHRLRAGRLEQLPVPHGLQNGSRQAGGTTAEVAAVLSTLRRSRTMGPHPAVAVRAHLDTVHPGDVLLLSTAGVHGAVPPDELARLLGGLGELADGVDRLLQRAAAHGGSDERTGILVRWPR